MRLAITVHNKAKMIPMSIPVCALIYWIPALKGRCRDFCCKVLPLWTQNRASPKKKYPKCFLLWRGDASQIFFIMIYSHFFPLKIFFKRIPMGFVLHPRTPLRVFKATQRRPRRPSPGRLRATPRVFVLVLVADSVCHTCLWPQHFIKNR